jgi:hypothetical protein
VSGGARRFVRSSLGALALLLAAPAAAAQDGDEAALAREALAVLPAEVRAGIALGWQARADCRAADPHEAVAVDLPARRLTLCSGAGPASLRRQVTFGAYLIADDRLGWSRQPRWRRLNGWTRDLATPWRLHPRNLADGAYAAPAGQRSPAWDLAAFAAAWTEERGSDPEGDAPLQCRLLPQAAFLHARLRALSPLPAPLRAPPGCRAFERWADRARLERIEIALATPSTVTMASMFGHVFLRLVTRTAADEPALLEDRTLAFLVESATPVTEDPFYAIKGIAGAFEANLLERSFLETYRTYVVTEGRDLRRYRLHLSPAETEALLQRLWSLRQASRYRYFFFGTNCATLMVDLLNSVLPDDRQIQVPRALATTPGGTLEGYARTAAAGGGPLLSFIPETILSFEHEARRAAAGRHEAALRLRAAAGAEARAQHDALWATVLAGAPGARADAYRALYQKHRDTPERRALAAVLRQSALVETHLQTLANLAAEQDRFRQRRQRLFAVLADLRTRLSQPGADGGGACAASIGEVLARTGSDEPAARLRGYARVGGLLAGPCAADPRADDLRRLVLLQSEARQDDPAMDPRLRDAILFPEPDKLLGEQRFAAGLSDLIDYPFVTELSPAVSALTAARADLQRLEGAGPGAWQVRREESAARRREEAAAHASAVPRTGIDEVEVGAGIDRRAGGARGLLVLAGAMHDERLGDQRRFGFAAHTALTVLRTQTAFAFDGPGRWPAAPAWQTRLVGYRSLRPGGPGASRLRPGGEVYADLGGRSRMGRALQARLGGGYLLPVLRSEDLADHLLVSAGLVGTFDQMGGAQMGGAQMGRAAWGMGAAIGIEGRLALDRRDHASWWAARALLRPTWTNLGPASELLAGAELRLPIREGVRLPFARGAPGAIGLRLAGEVVAFTRPAAVDPQIHLTLAWE